MNWFNEQYDQTCEATPILVHPSRKIEQAATLPKGSRIITANELASFRDSFRDFCKAVANLPGFGTTSEVSQLLAKYELLGTRLLNKYAAMPIT